MGGVEQGPGTGETRRHARLGEEAGDTLVVLLGQHLGGRHDGRLVPALDTHQQRCDRYHGLARTDFAVEQAVHRHRRRHVRTDLIDYPALGAGGPER